MADNLGDVIDQDMLSPLARLAGARSGGVGDLWNLITGNTGTISAANAPQIPDAPDPIRPSPVTTQMTRFIRGAPGTQSGFAVPDPNALPNVRPNSPLAANTAGIRGFPGTQSGPGWGKPDPYAHMPPPDPPDPPPPMPKPVADTRPDLPGQPGAKEPDHTQWGVSHSPLADLINRVMKHLDDPSLPPPDLKELPRPVSQQVENSWMSTVLSSAGLLLAAFGSRRSAAPMTAAIKSFGGYLQGYQQGQEEVWKQKQAEYKEQLDYALQRNQLELDRYKAAVEASKGDTAKMHEALYAASLLNEDERGKALLEQGRSTEFFKYVDAMQKWWDQVQSVRDYNRISGLHLPEPPKPELPEDLRNYIFGGGGEGGGGGGGGSSGGYTGPIGIAISIESSGRPTVTGGDTSSGPSRGILQITDGTWKQFAPPEVQRKWPRADLAPTETQIEIGKTIPANRWGPDTKAAWHRRYGDFDESQTLGQLQQRFGGGTQVAGPGGAPDTGTTSQPAAPDTSADMPSGTPIDQAAQEYLDTGKLPDLKGPNAERFQTDVMVVAARKADELKATLSRLPANATPAQTQAALDKLNPQAATIVKAMIDGTYPVPSSSWAMRGNYWPMMFSIAKRIAPNLDANTYETRKAIIKDIFVGKDGQNLTSVATAYKHGAALIASAAGLTKGDRFTGVLGNTAIGNLLSSTELSEYNANRLDFAGEYAKALYGGVGTGAERNSIYNSLSPSKSAPALAATIRTYIARLREKMQESRIRLTELGAAGNMQDVQRLFQTYTQEDPTLIGQLASDPAGGGSSIDSGWSVTEHP